MQCGMARLWLAESSRCCRSHSLSVQFMSAFFFFFYTEDIKSRFVGLCSIAAIYLQDLWLIRRPLLCFLFYTLTRPVSRNLSFLFLIWPQGDPQHVFCFVAVFVVVLHRGEVLTSSRPRCWIYCHWRLEIQAGLLSLLKVSVFAWGSC